MYQLREVSKSELRCVTNGEAMTRYDQHVENTVSIGKRPSEFQDEMLRIRTGLSLTGWGPVQERAILRQVIERRGSSGMTRNPMPHTNGVMSYV